MNLTREMRTVGKDVTLCTTTTNSEMLNIESMAHRDPTLVMEWLNSKWHSTEICRRSNATTASHVHAPRYPNSDVTLPELW